MLYYRRKIILALIETFGGQLTAKRLQKLLFLLTRKQDVKTFDFVPYRYGCFSFQANQDVVTLQTYGYLSIEQTPTGRFIKLEKSGKYDMDLNMFDRQYLADIKNEFGHLSQNELIRYTYVHYPYYSTKSAIAEEILTESELASVKKQIRFFAEPCLFSIGYEGITLEQYVNKLIINDVRILCDVRKNAFSQKYGFSKSQLKTACKGVDIQYVHIPDLGIESEYRQDLRSQRDYDILFDMYEKTTLTNNTTAIEQVHALLKDNKRLALTCFEKNPQQCHRSRVAQRLLVDLRDDFLFKDL